MFLLLLLLLCCLWFKIHYHYLLLDIFSWRQLQYLLEIIHNFGLSLNPFQLCQLGFSQDAYGVLKIEWECNSLVKLFRFSFSLLEKVMLFKGLIHFICYPVYFHKGVHNILFPFGLWRIRSGIFFSISDNVHMCFFFLPFSLISLARCLPVNVFEEPTFGLINFLCYFYFTNVFSHLNYFLFYTDYVVFT